MNPDIKVIDDFLPLEIFQNFAYECMTVPMYSPCDFCTRAIDTDGSIVGFGEDLAPAGLRHEVMLAATFYQNFLETSNRRMISDFWRAFPHVEKLLYEKLNMSNLVIARVNCTLKEDKHYKSAWHTDIIQPWAPSCDTAILYLNTNNGGTRFNDDEETIVKSKANRMVIFPTTLEHGTYWHTDAKLRFVLNLNYERKSESDTEESN